jgi:hypothetical protein
VSTTTKLRPVDPLDPLGRIAEQQKRPYDHDAFDISDIAVQCHWRNHYRDAWRGETPAQLRARRVLLLSDLALVEERLANARAVLKDAQGLPIAVAKRDDANATIARATARKARLDGMERAIWELLCEASGSLTKGGYPRMLRVVHVNDEIDRALYIGRPNRRRPPRPQRYGLEPRPIFGNPFAIGRDGDRAVWRVDPEAAGTVGGVTTGAESPTGVLVPA